jgi:hypothetical protein
MSFETKLNVKTSSRQLPNARTENRQPDFKTPDPHKTYIPPDPITEATIGTFAFLALRVATVRT